MIDDSHWYLEVRDMVRIYFNDHYNSKFFELLRYLQRSLQTGNKQKNKQHHVD